jgi:hypothetical protein
MAITAKVSIHIDLPVTSLQWIPTNVVSAIPSWIGPVTRAVKDVYFLILMELAYGFLADIMWR